MNPLAPGRSDLLGRLCLLVAIAVTPFFRYGLYQDARPNQLQFKYLALMLGLGGLLVLLTGVHRRMRRLTAGSVLVAAFGGWALITCLWSREPLLSLREWSLMGSGLVIYALVVSNRLPTQRLFRPLMWAVIFTATLNALFADLHFLFEKGPFANSPLGPGLGRALSYGNLVLEGKRNIRAMFSHPNFLSIYLVMAVAFVAMVVAGPRRECKPVPLLVLVIGLVVCWLIPGMQEDDRLINVIQDKRIFLMIAAVLGTAAFTWLTWKFPRLRRPTMLLALLGILAAIVVCRSRSGWMALSLVTCLGTAMAWRHRRVRGWQFAVLLLAFMVAGLGINHLRNVRDSTKSMEEVATFSSATSRMYNFGLAARQAMIKPMTGWGYGTFKIEYYLALSDPRLVPDDPGLYLPHLREAKGRPPIHVHNDYLEMLMETGVPGLAIFLLLMCWTGVRLLEIALASPAREITWQALALGCALIAVLFDMLLSFPLNLPLSASLFWLVMGFAHRLHQDWEESREISPG